VGITGGLGVGPPSYESNPPQFCVFEHGPGGSVLTPPQFTNPLMKVVEFGAKNASKLIFDHVYFQKNSGVYTTTTLKAEVQV